MYITCLDLEGVLVPEIWIAFAEASGIPELTRTTRDEPDYDKLMHWRLGILREHGLGLREIQETIAGIDPLPGAREFLDELRAFTQVIIISDTFTQFAAPLMKKLGWPTLFCNTLEVAPDGEIIEWTVTPDEIGERDYLFIKDNRDEFIEYLQSKAGVVSAEFSMERIEIAFDRDYIAGIAGGSILPPGEHTRLVREIANKIVAEGTKNTTEGNWVHFFDEFGENDAFVQENAEEIAAELERRQEVSDVVPGFGRNQIARCNLPRINATA